MAKINSISFETPREVLDFINTSDGITIISIFAVEDPLDKIWYYQLFYHI
jgi:hypothetical protein